MPSRRAVLLNVTLTVVTCVVVLLAIEGAVRVLNLAPVEDRKGGLNALLEFDPVLETRYKANAKTEIRSPYGEYDVKYSTNDLGLRDHPSKPATDRDYRVLVVGNSFVEGWGVTEHDSLVRVAERTAEHQLDSNGEHRPLRVVNAGISAYGAAQIYLQTRALWSKVDPDMVVMVIIGTMVSADHKFLTSASLDNQNIAQGLSATAVLAGGTNAANEKPAISPFLERLSGYSAAVRFVVRRLENRSMMDAIKPGDPATDMLAAYRSNAAYLAKMYEPTLRHAAALANFVQQKGKTFILVHLPMAFEIDAKAWDQGRKAYRLEDRVYDSGEEKIVQTFCESHRLTCLFAEKPLKQADTSDPKPLYFRYDFHLTSEGNRIVGEWLGKNLATIIRRQASTMPMNSVPAR